MFYRWKLCRIEAINSTAYLSTGKMMQPLYWAHCFSRASAISNIRCLWACESLNAGEVASQRNARGECGLPLVFLSSCIHTKESVANSLPTNSFGYPRPLLASRTDQRTKKRIRTVSWNGTRCVIIGYCQLFAPSLQKWPPPFSWSLLVRCSHVRVVPMRLVVHQGSRWSWCMSLRLR